MSAAIGADTKRLSSPGYTLAEALVVIALLGLMVLFGGPALMDSLRAYKVRSDANNLTTILRALRYGAVSNRAPMTITVNDENDATAPNTCGYVDLKGRAVTVRMQDGVVIEGSSAPSITFNINGGTGQTGSLTVLVSGRVNKDRADRYAISVSPTGTVSSDYSTYTP
ncbi:MAG: Tfp pilus assembly protein FimT/FimU [Acidobacteriota bacterium]